ncbi:hypothetical protein OSB04_019386 [Centaurea solstitialis]|uniref:Reverse transcriptase domain-containing protein n=1 Tax=Centaurea solstitialis TaxID=347529 RepID=A0AA38SXV7_9ASTR|nr:hypothetical protein OSB04_019386 [Centaurea solstitialis]
MEIMTFKQGDKILTTTWERFKWLTHMYPNHDISKDDLVTIFYRFAELPLNYKELVQKSAELITTRSGKEVKSPPMPLSNSLPILQEVEIEEETPSKQPNKEKDLQKKKDEVDELADRSLKYPMGIAENVPVKVDRFVFPVDFVILDMAEDNQVPLILGRPFLNTSNAVIHLSKKQLALGVIDEIVSFLIEKAIRYTKSTNDTCYFMDILNPCTEKEVKSYLSIGKKLDALCNNPKWWNWYN